MPNRYGSSSHSPEVKDAENQKSLVDPLKKEPSNNGSLGGVISDVFFSPSEILQKDVIVENDFEELEEYEFGESDVDADGFLEASVASELDLEDLPTEMVEIEMGREPLDDDDQEDLPTEIEARPREVQQPVSKPLISEEELAIKMEDFRKWAASRQLKSLGWTLSEKNMKKWNASELELRVKKQKGFDRDIIGIQKRHGFIDSTFEKPPMPRSLSSVEGLRTDIEEKEQQVEEEETKTIKGLRKKAQAIGWRPIRGIGLTDLREQIGEQAMLSEEYQKYKDVAEQIEWEGFEEAKCPMSREQLDEIGNSLTEQLNYIELNKKNQTAKEHMAWAPDLPKPPFNNLAIAKYNYIIDVQQGFYDRIVSKLNELPLKHQVDFRPPRPPFTEEVCIEYGGEVDVRVLEVEEHNRKVRRILKLLRLGFICSVVMLLTFWELNLISEISDLDLRSSKIGIVHKKMAFPYLPGPVWERREFVREQERLAPHFETLQTKAAVLGLSLSTLPKPYRESELNRWQKALEHFEFSLVPAGKFIMGSEDGMRDSSPMHTVSITRPVYMQKTEVTQALYEAMMMRNPASNVTCGPNCPVDRLSWVDAARFSNRVSEFSNLEPCYQISGNEVKWAKGLDCLGYRLPTEAEWEFAARAKNKFPYSGSFNAHKVAWTEPRSKLQMQAVAKLSSNAFGMYDMSGSVWEWCWDRYSDYTKKTVIDPTGGKEGAERVKRGGGFLQTVVSVSRRSSMITIISETGIGMRLVRTAPK